MKILFKLFIFFCSLQIVSQTANNYHKVEEYILSNKKDSAFFYLNKLPDDVTDKEFLKKLIKNEHLTFKDYQKFILRFAERENFDVLHFSNYINKNLKIPKNSSTLHVDYFNIKWVQISKLRNEALLAEASKVQNDLEDYVNLFTESDAHYIWAKTKLKTHPIVMYLIEKDIDKGKKLTLECLKIARELEDVELEIVFLYHLTSFLVFENKLDEYIDVCEKGIELEKKLEKKSVIYYSNITNLINAYIYKGGNNDRVLKLIDEVYKSHSRIYSYTLYAQLMSTLKNDAQLKEDILKKFEVSNILDFAEKLLKLGKSLNPIDLYKLNNTISTALVNHEYYKEALLYKDNAININRKIYSQDLSKSLANYKVEQTVKVKEHEISGEKEKSKLYLIIALLCFTLLIISFLVLKKIRAQSSELSKKNVFIQNSLKEKELLIKEVHHRVKNNFQIITSLLDLQSEEIEDKRLLEIVENGRNRIKSMALIHQKLYLNEPGLINFKEYTKSLIKQLSCLYKFDDEVKVEIDAEVLFFDVDTATPLALILNEIFTNSLKYAFTNEEEKRIFVSLKKKSEGLYHLMVKDNGCGIDKNFDVTTTKSSGLKLITRLIKQLHGKLKITNEKGVKYDIIFKDSKARKQVN